MSPRSWLARLVARLDRIADRPADPGALYGGTASRRTGRRTQPDFPAPDFSTGPAGQESSDLDRILADQRRRMRGRRSSEGDGD